MRSNPGITNQLNKRWHRHKHGGSWSAIILAQYTGYFLYSLRQRARPYCHFSKSPQNRKWSTDGFRCGHYLLGSGHFQGCFLDISRLSIDQGCLLDLDRRYEIICHHRHLQRSSLFLSPITHICSIQHASFLAGWLFVLSGPLLSWCPIVC
jgi:hypothetical protein